ncbi:helix-turn-helix domain-containing protein [Clostridium estertheticum]|uniref:helix-turn-helix domain-containing protein n=1 Tax=Clostridium estertheticum TaxID=238834 RepID=UPI001CF3132A|nr:helix-turn-helix domain-containing protein [Clostridium estertheticum]MCB2354724.1 helix-turn-helix domain-containing protein [Clostridium estertheticum]WAG40966.1 helix-turn-helix domain-containing protein [Clostridium estertheticum]
MNTKFVSNYTDEERSRCVEQYFTGYNKDQLAQIWGVSKRTVERWIKEYERTDAIKIRIAKRSKLMTVDIQHEIMQILNSNAILHGFNISTWNEAMVIKLLKDKYYIKITRYMAEELLSDKKYFSSECEEKVLNELNDMEKLGYKLILLDYIRIGRVDKRTIEPLFYKKFKEHRLNVNLGIARGTKTAYLDIIFSDVDILEKPQKIELVQLGASIKVNGYERKVIANDKFDFIKKVLRKETNNKNVVFISTGDTDIKEFKNNNENALFFIVNKDLYKQLVQDEYEKDECNGDEKYSLIQHLYNINNEYINFTSFEDIRRVIENKVIKYEVELNYKMKNEENTAKHLGIGSKITIL